MCCRVILRQTHLPRKMIGVRPHWTYSSNSLTVLDLCRDAASCQSGETVHGTRWYRRMVPSLRRASGPCCRSQSRGSNHQDGVGRVSQYGRERLPVVLRGLATRQVARGILRGGFRGSISLSAMDACQNSGAFDLLGRLLRCRIATSRCCWQGILFVDALPICFSLSTPTTATRQGENP